MSRILSGLDRNVAENRDMEKYHRSGKLFQDAHPTGPEVRSMQDNRLNRIISKRNLAGIVVHG